MLITALLLLLTLAPVFGPWIVLRAIVPLGAPKIASWAARALGYRDLAIDPSLPCMFGALAAYHAKDASAASADVRAELASLHNVGAGGVVGAALLRDLAGDRAGARALMESVGELTPLVVTRASLAVADTWLLADAAERGDVDAMLGHAEKRRVWTPSVALLGACARRLARGERGAPDWLLLATFALAARPRARKLVERALAQRAEAPRPQRRPEEQPTPTDPLGRALALHAEILRSGEASFFLLGRAGAAWDAAITDRELAREVEARAAALGARGDALVLLRETAEEELAAWARSREVCLADVPEQGTLLAGASRRLRAELLGDIEATAGSLARRASDERELPSVDEWAEWDAVRRRLDRALRTGGRDARRLAMATLSRDVSDYAIWLFNKRKEKVLANAVFRWLAREAAAAGDVETAELQGRNAQLSVR